MDQKLVDSVRALQCLLAGSSVRFFLDFKFRNPHKVLDRGKRRRELKGYVKRVQLEKAHRRRIFSASRIYRWEHLTTMQGSRRNG